jgi:hypothetical protein
VSTMSTKFVNEHQHCRLVSMLKHAARQVDMRRQSRAMGVNWMLFAAQVQIGE